MARNRGHQILVLGDHALPTATLHAQAVRPGHGRWDIENDCFNTLSTHWGLDHCYKHDPTAIVNLTLTLFIVFVLLQCFWLRNLKLPRRVQLTLIALARELDRTLAGCRAPWYPQLLRGP